MANCMGRPDIGGRRVEVKPLLTQAQFYPNQNFEMVENLYDFGSYSGVFGPFEPLCN
jgi:hypothetical protein